MLGLGNSNLFSDLDVEVVPDAPIGSMTWYGVGGHADVLVRPHSVDALALLSKRCHREGVPLRILGSGANLLVGDDGVDGIVVQLDRPVFREVKYNTTGELYRVHAMAGADMARTLMDAARQGLEGLSQMAGIPATIGGAVCMNAGGTYGGISDNIHSVSCITRAGQKVAYPASELIFGYRSTNIPDPIIIGATFNLTPDDPIALRRRVKEIFQYKKSTQPLAEHSAGCVFKNPIDPVTEKRVSAGKLIDEANLKGLHMGGASVSTHHANFVVAHPGATSRDICDLIDEIRRRVFDSSGIELEREIVIWHRDEES